MKIKYVMVLIICCLMPMISTVSIPDTIDNNYYNIVRPKRLCKSTCTVEECELNLSECVGKVWYNKDNKIHREDGPAVMWKDGLTKYYKDGKLSREDGPAIIKPNGDMYWYIDGIKQKTVTKKYTKYYKDGKLSREDGPAIIYSNNDEMWFLDGKLHNINAPAIIYHTIINDNSIEVWCQYGKLHREDGPAIIYPNGDKEWYINGKLYNPIGPSIVKKDGINIWTDINQMIVKIKLPDTRIKEYLTRPYYKITENNIIKYYKNNKLHREDGPAIIYPNGDKEWYFNNRLVRVFNKNKNTDNWYIGNNLYKIRYFDNTIKYFGKNGKLHREDGPAVIYPNGNKEWYKDGKLHNDNGFAIDYIDGTRKWYIDGKLSREDGPAVILCIEGQKTHYAWYINGREFTEKEYRRKTGLKKTMTSSDLSKILGYEVKIIK